MSDSGSGEVLEKYSDFDVLDAAWKAGASFGYTPQAVVCEHGLLDQLELEFGLRLHKVHQLVVDVLRKGREKVCQESVTEVWTELNVVQMMPGV